MANTIPWLEPDTPFPHPDSAWTPTDPAPGLLAAGATLDTARLLSAYRQGIFPWFSAGQPILWWSPNPRMVLPLENFRLHRSLRKTISRFRYVSSCEIKVDTAFDQVIAACAAQPRSGQHGTWIVPEMIKAYLRMHEQGHAHSVETWVDGELVGGLYCISIGTALFGESMFARQTDASKIALAALVCIGRRHGVPWIDCQQNTQHLSSLGGIEIPRFQFLKTLENALTTPEVDWRFAPSDWHQVIGPVEQTA